MDDEDRIAFKDGMRTHIVALNSAHSERAAKRATRRADRWVRNMRWNAMFASRDDKEDMREWADKVEQASNAVHIQFEI